MNTWHGSWRLGRALGVMFVLLSIVAGGLGGCSDGGGSSGGTRASDPAPAPTPPPPSGGTSQDRRVATLAWAPASGPVAGYRVYVEWDDSGSFDPHRDTLAAVVAIEGDVGQSMRMQVAALDATGAEGPRSPASKPIVFTTRMPPPRPGGSQGSVAVATRTASAYDPEPDPDADAEPTRPAPLGPGVAGDVDGDGSADLLFESADGSRLRFTDAALEVWLELTRPASAWSWVGTGDMDGDGLADLWWQHDAGDVAITRASALLDRPDRLPLEPFARLDAGERILRVADYDGDGQGDAMVRDADATTLWLTRDTAFELWEVASPDPDALQVVGSGDLDGDDHVDLVWISGSGGLLAQFLRDGRVDGQAALTGAGDPVAVADFDGDGAAELLFQEPDGWSAHGLSDVSGPWPAVPVGSASLVGCADYDGDGAADLLWHDAGTLRFEFLPGEETVDADAGWTPTPLCR